VYTYHMDTNASQATHFQSFEKAREATLTLLALKDTLTSSELETLEILLDKSTKEQLVESVQDAKDGRVEPLDSILD
jgi:hypothetical protein